MCNIRVESLEESVQKLSNFMKANKIMMSATSILFWVKDLNLKHLTINQAACDLLYPGATPDALTGLTDWEYSQKIGCSEEMVDRIKHRCSVSDRYILDHNDRVSGRFYEKVKTIDGKEMWLLTTKEKIPPTNNGVEMLGIFGTAMYFPCAENFIKNGYQQLEKLTDSIYVIKD